MESKTWKESVYFNVPGSRTNHRIDVYASKAGSTYVLYLDGRKLNSIKYGSLEAAKQAVDVFIERAKEFLKNSVSSIEEDL